MKIRVDARLLGVSGSGIAQYSENLLSALSGIDSENEYVVNVGAGSRRKLRAGKNFHISPVGGRPNTLRGMARMAVALRRERCDLVHAHQVSAPPALLGSDTPFIFTVHDTVPFQPLGPGRREGLRRRLERWVIDPMAVARARWIVCVSRTTRDRLAAMFPDAFHKSIVIPSGVEDSYREPVPPELEATTASRLNLPERYVLYSGPAWGSKNLPRAIECFAELIRREPLASEHRFVLDLTDTTEGLRDIHAAMQATGTRERVKIFKGLDAGERRVVTGRAEALFVASRTEGFHFPALRAQLVGAPIVAADDGALPEICGDGALLVDPDDLDETVEMLRRALFDDDLREYLRMRGRANAAGYTWRETALRLRQVYELLF